MNTLRFSLAKLLAAVVVVALGLAALVNASELWMVVSFSLTIGLLLLGIVGVVYRRRLSRSFWVGFSLFGSSYFLLSFISIPTGSRQWPHLRQLLPTQSLVEYVYPKVRRLEIPPLDPDRTIMVRLRSDKTFSVGGKRVGADAAAKWLEQKVRKDCNKTVYFVNDPGTDPSRFERLLGIPKGITGFHTISTSPLKWHFEQVAYAFSSILFGIFGGLLARYLYATRERTA